MSVDREAVWNVRKICEMVGQLLERSQAFYWDVIVRVGLKVAGELSESFVIGVEVRQGYVMLL